MPRHGGATQRERGGVYVHDDDGRGLRALSREELFVSGRGEEHGGGSSSTACCLPACGPGRLLNTLSRESSGPQGACACAPRFPLAPCASYSDFVGLRCPADPQIRSRKNRSSITPNTQRCPPSAHAMPLRAHAC